MANFGEATWKRVEARSETDASHYVSTTPYPDELTMGIVTAACEELNVAAADLLHTFGKHWVLNTAKTEYEDLMALCGDDLKTFLINLDRMHEQVAFTFQNLQQPSFELETVDGDTLLHYRSARNGLSEFVVGLLMGLSEYFDEPITIDQVAFKSDGADHDIFKLQFTH